MAELAPAGQPRDFRLGFAGDTFNTAWYLARIATDIDVSYLTAVGDDVISEDMRAFMRCSRINDAYVQIIDGKTVGLYLIHLKEGERSFSYWRDTAAARQLAMNKAVLDEAMQNADLIYFSGITLAILDPDSRVNLFDALKRARSKGKTVAFDTNLRPRLWKRPQEMKETIRLAAEQADIVLPSFDDEAAWFGDRDAYETLARYTRYGAPNIIVKNSSEPVLFQQDGAVRHVNVEPASTVVDTTAAGDSFNAAVLASTMKSIDFDEGIKAGCQLAGQVVRQKGALVPVDFELRKVQT